MGAILWPVRPALRVPVTLTATVLLADASMIGLSRGGHGLQVRGSEITMMVLHYLFFSIVGAIVVRLRRWRLVPAAPAVRYAGTQFGLYGLLGVITLTGLMLGIGHWVQPWVAWPDSWRGWKSGVDLSAGIALIATGLCLPMIFWLPAALAPRIRGRHLGWALASVAIVAAILFALLVTWVPVYDRNQQFVRWSFLLAGGYGSMIGSLFVVRLCGIRLVRAGRGLEGSPNEAAS
jgi:hypothetical protein